MLGTLERAAHAQPKVDSAALPAIQLWAIAPLGAKSGVELEVKVTAGVDLDNTAKLLFSHPGITSKPKMEVPAYGGAPQPVPSMFLVTVAKEVPPGTYDVRAVGQYGISNPRSFIVGQLDEVTETADNTAFNKALSINLESTVNGTANAANPDFYKFAAKKGQRVIVDVWAQRLDSRMDASLILFDSRGVELARNRNANRRDPLLDLTVPADGEYVVAVYDFLYEGGAEHFYRLNVHTGPYVDFVWPPVALPGSKQVFKVYGRNLPGGVSAKGVEVAGRTLEQISVTLDIPKQTDTLALPSFVASSEVMLDNFEYRVQSSQKSSNPVLIGLAAAPVVLEQEPNNDPAHAQKVTVPCDYVGQFAVRADEDWIQFDAKKGAVYYIEMVSQRFGLPTDPSVVIQRVTQDAMGVEKTTDVTELDDDTKDLVGTSFPTVNGDASYRLQVGEDSTYRVLVRDLYGSVGDPRRVYRLSIREPKPDFRLAAVPAYPTLGKDARPWNVELRRGASETIDVAAFRRDGFNEPIEVSVEGLPAGVTCKPTLLGPDQDALPLVVTATENAVAWSGAIKIVGKAKIGDQTVTRAARGGTTIWPAVVVQNQPGKPSEARAARELTMAVVASESVPVAITLGEGKAWDMSRAGKVEIPVKITRREGFKEALTLTPLGLPAIFKPQPVAIAAGASDGKVTFDVPGNAPLGTFSFYLRAPAKVSYKRDAAGADKAANFKKEMEKLSTDLAAAVKTAEKAVQDADKAAKDAQAELKKATDANRAALDAKAKETAAKKTAADEALKVAQAKAKAAGDAKTVADKKATDMANAAKPKDLNIIIPSNVAQLSITAAPIKLSLKNDKPSVKVGEQIDIAVAAERLYGFADAIELEVALPPELKNVKVTPKPIAKGQNEAPITLATAKDSAAGTYTITLRGKPKFNNQNLTVEQTFTLKVNP